MVATDHIGKLLLGIGKSVGVSPSDGPVNRNLAPYQDTHTLSLAHHLLVVRIVGQTHKVTTQFLSP